MTTRTVTTHALEDVAERLERALEGQARFERSYTLARGQFDERQSAIAAAVLTNGDAVRGLRTELAKVAAQVEATGQVAVEALSVGRATQMAVANLDSWMRARFATEDVEKGQLLAEIARLDSADAVAEKRDERVEEEITSMHRRQEAARLAMEAQQKKHDEVVARAEADRARSTLRAGLATALPAALFSFLKEHPGAFETAWKALASAIGGGH